MIDIITNFSAGLGLGILAAGIVFLLTAGTAVVDLKLEKVFPDRWPVVKSKFAKGLLWGFFAALGLIFLYNLYRIGAAATS